MKLKSLHIFAVFVAILTAIPIANAAEITYSINTAPLWEKAGHYEAAKTIAVSNNQLYVLADPTKQTTIAYVGQNTNWTTFESGYGTWAHGFAFDNDDAGNIIMQGNSTGSATNKLIVYPAGATSNASKKEITITSPGGRTDFIRIQGNILSGTAYVWFVPASTQKIVRVKIVNGKEDSRTEWTHTLGNASSTEIAYMLDDGRIYLHHRKGSPNYAYLLTVPANGGAVTSSEEVLSGTSASNLTSDIFNIQGTYFHVYNAGNEGQDIRFNIKNLSTGAILASNITPFNGEKWDKSGTSNLSNFNSIGTIIRPIKVNVNTVDLYCFTPEHGASVYRVTAIVKAEGVNSPKATASNETNVVVSWSKPTTDVPTNYSVSYSSDGGSTWSTPIVTTNLSHTFNNLAIGSYTFKIIPYYEQYLTYGAEKTTESVEIVDPTKPVSNISASVVGDSYTNVKVSWSKPVGGTPSKYAVSYSNDSGSSWSTAVETTSTSYTFNDLPIGSYIFKVKPYYTSSWGEEATSETVLVQTPTGYTFIVTKKWEAEGTLNNDGDKTTPAGKSIAVSKDVLYVSAMNQYATISYVNKDKYPSWPNFPSGYNKSSFGYGMDNDDAGNIIVAANSTGTSTPKKFAVYPAGATNADRKKEFTLSDSHLPGGRADYIAAQGDIYNGTGYLWFAPRDTKNIKRIKIENKSGVPTSTEMITWTHGLKNNYSEVVVRPLEDGRLYYHYHTGDCKIITLPEGGGEIPSENIETISLTSNQTTNFSSDAIILKGNLLNIRNAGIAQGDISFEVYNTTTKTYATYNGEQVITPFEGVRTTGEINPLSGLGNGSTTIASVIRAIKVDNNTVDIYVYSPYHGASCYRIGASPIFTVTDALEGLSYEYEKVEGGQTIATQQNIKLTWIAPNEASPTSYRIYRGETLIAEVDASTLSYTDKNVTQNNTYKVIPYFTGVAEDASLGREVTTTEVIRILNAPYFSEIRNYEHYSLTELFYKMPEGNKLRPIYFNLYRDGKLIQGKLQSYNTLDESLVEDRNNDIPVKYQIEAVFGETASSTTPTDSIKGEIKEIVIAYRDIAKTKYILQEIYNVPIDEIPNLPNIFDNNDYYRQGQFYNGHWYIAQRADDLCQKDQDKANGIVNSIRDDMKSDNANATGGIVMFKATTESDIRAGYVEKVLTNEAFANVGIAMDDVGTIFVRNNNINKLTATIPADGNATEVAKLSDGFGRRITEGTFYKRNEDGSYTAVAQKLDLTALWTSNNWINQMAFSSGKSYGQVVGRSDYYHMWGDVLGDGGYMILSPSWTRTAFKIYIKGGVYQSHEVIEFNRYENQGYELTPTTGAENYGFHLDGRPHAWTAQIRSNGYFGVHDATETEQMTWHPIFTADSRINNAGGTSIVAFGHNVTQEEIDEEGSSYEQGDLGKSTGDLFIITPQSMHSKNVGDFLVSRATKNNAYDLAEDGSLMPSTPVALKVQTDERSKLVATNANGNWFHAEKGTYSGPMSDADECVDIYQYVPGTRFARYRLIPSSEFPPVQPTLKITTAYNDGKTEITHFDGVATWKRPERFNDDGKGNAKVDKYLFKMYNSKNELIATTELPEEWNSDGTPNGDYVYNFNYKVATGKDATDVDLDFSRYSVRVEVMYVTLDGITHISEPGYAEAEHDYPAVAPEVTNVAAFKQANGKIYEWVEEDGQQIVKERIVDNYRVEINFNKPVNDEPVTYYTVRAIRNKIVNGQNTTDTIEITDFDLHLGKDVSENGVTRAKYETVSQIPGTYDFDNNKAPFYISNNAIYGKDGESQFDGVLTWHHVVPAGTYGNNSTRASEVILEPDNWTFEVVAHYAARNRYIHKPAVGYNTPDEIIVTGVEVIGEDDASSLQIYPIPASTEITIKAAEAINTIVIYNEAGAEVMSLAGNGETINTVNIENLATGYYFVKVNNHTPVTIIKK